ncbi:MAG: hypothetical protein BGO57_15650 [Sphingomonadales bacterium 63-6]|nr:MAG: hypothetical protein BGO57_15650 [Sphingomonadales bacterium 63-6]
MIAAVLLIFAIILGGGGTPNPSTEVWLEILAGLLILNWLWLPGPLCRPADPALWLLALIVIAIPLLQLVPMPPQLWQALPGGEVRAEALDLIGREDSWQPFTESAPRTLASLLSLVPPLALMLMVGSLARPERQTLLAIAAVLALLSAVLGAFQLAGGGAFRLYEASHPGVVLGFQANRNAEVDILLIGLLALAAFVAGHAPSQRRPGVESIWRNGWLVGGVALLLVLAAVLTASRAGIALLLPVLVAGWAILVLDRRRNWKGRGPAIAAGVLAVLGGGLFLVRHNVVLQRVAERFDFSGDGREGLWRDTLYAIGQTWPFGTGMGTFAPTFIAFEPLEAVDSSIPNRAHNDYLELLLEAGIFGAVALVLACGLILFMTWRSWRRAREWRPQIAFGFSVLVVIAAHSVVDYPLRSMSLACLAGLAVGMFARSPKINGPAASQTHH